MFIIYKNKHIELNQESNLKWQLRNKKSQLYISCIEACVHSC